MVYCVVPRELADELYEKLVDHYRDDDNVTVIVDRREFDRRGRAGAPPAGGEDGAQPNGAGAMARDGAPAGVEHRRVLRDRRRARVPGELLPLAGVASR